MSNKVCAIVQYGDGWYGVSFRSKGRQLTNINISRARTPAEVEQQLGEPPCSFALEDGGGYLVPLTFPFSGKRRIELIIANELAEKLPFPADDMIIGFKETGKGRVLSAAIPKSVLAELNGHRGVRHITLHSLAVLYALRWFNVIYQDDFVFLHVHGDTTVIMAFKENSLHCLRQFCYGPDSPALNDALQDIANDKGFHPRGYFMVNDNADAEALREGLERALHVRIEAPSLKRCTGDENIPEWAWHGIGSGLLSLNSRNEINLSGGKTRALPPWNRFAIYALAGLAGISLLVCGLFYLDYSLKTRVYTHLIKEPARFYALSFPKSPPVKDVARAFHDKLGALEKDSAPTSLSLNTLVLLNEISSRIEGNIDVKLVEFSLEEKEFALAGITTSVAALDKIKAAIEQIPGVSTLEVVSLDVAQNRQVAFKMRGKL